MKFLIGAWLLTGLLFFLNYMTRLRPQVARGLPFWQNVADVIVTFASALLWPVWLLLDGLTATWRRVSARPIRNKNDQQYGWAEGPETLPDGSDSGKTPLDAR